MRGQSPWRVANLCFVLSLVGLVSGCASGDERPQQDRVDTELSSADYAVRLGSCLDSRGAEWELGPRGESVLIIETPAQPRSVQQHLLDGCHKELVERGLTPAQRAITPALLEEVFDNAAIVRECIQELGFSVPDMPNRREFVEGGGSLPDLFGSIPGTAMPGAFRLCAEAYR